MKKLSLARIFKNISYVILPFFIILFGMSVFAQVALNEIPEIDSGKDYFESKLFSDKYYEFLQSRAFDFSNVVNGKYKLEKNKQSIINGREGMIYYSSYNADVKALNYLMVDNEKGIALTNVRCNRENDTIEKIKSNLSKNTIFWNEEEGITTTNINNLANVNISNYVSKAVEKVDIFSSINSDLMNNEEFRYDKSVYDIRKNISTHLPIQALVFNFVISVILILIIINGIGKKGDSEEIKFNSFDKIPFEVATVLCGLIGCIAILPISLGMLFDGVVSLIICCIIVAGLIAYMAGIIWLETTVKRIKAHKFLKTTLVYMIYSKVKSVINNRKKITKLIIYFGTFTIIELFSLVFGMIHYEMGFTFLAIILLLIVTFAILYKKVIEYKKIEETLKELYEGNTNVKLEEDEFTGDLKNVAKYINEISNGVSNAVDEKLKSERLKTELITNVSHDIKTPLTSIINYVDLLKKEEVNDNTKEYLQILDSKSQRLKQLIEDLVEASKASSGNIKLNKEKINISELINQISGEFSDKFKEKNLEEVITLPKDDIFVIADGRYMYRIIENLYSNISKYSLENTRVYIDVSKIKDEVCIKLKNVSKDKLNISAEELMERFVRGDRSRNTEGSGLGLSIASSLTKLQNGDFNIYLDGDLFKITLKFKIKE